MELAFLKYKKCTERQGQRCSEPTNFPARRAARRSMNSSIAPSARTSSPGSSRAGKSCRPARALAEHLNVSKITVETAYAQLLAEGYVTARQRAGYYVEQLSALQPAEPQPRVPVKPEAPEPPAKPSAALFPFSVWAKLMRGVILDEGEALLRPMPGAGLYALRARDLRRSAPSPWHARRAAAGLYRRGRGIFLHLLL